MADDGEGATGPVSTFSHSDMREERGLGVSTHLGAHGSASPARAIDVVTRGEEANVEQRFDQVTDTVAQPTAQANPTTPADPAGAVGPHSYISAVSLRGSTPALRLREGQVTDTVTNTTAQANPIAPADQAGAVGPHSYISAVSLRGSTPALRLREGQVTDTVTNTTAQANPIAPADQAGAVGPHSYISAVSLRGSTPALRLREGQVTDTVANQGAADWVGPVVLSSYIPARAPNPRGGLPVPAATTIENGGHPFLTEPDYDPPVYDDGVSRPDRTSDSYNTDGHDADGSVLEALPTYRRHALLPPLYSPPRQKKTKALAPTAAPCPPAPRAITIADLQALAKHRAEKRVAAALSGGQMPTVQPLAGKKVPRLFMGSSIRLALGRS